MWAEEELKTGTLSNGTVENYLGAIRCIKKHPIADHHGGTKKSRIGSLSEMKNGNIGWMNPIRTDGRIKNPNRHGIRIPVLDENGVQKVGTRNRKQWKRVLTDATGWNNPKNCELWRSEWANVCNAHLKTENHIDHRSYARQGKLEIPTIHEGADARKN